MSTDSPVENLAKIAKLMDAFNEHLQESTQKILHKVQKRYRHVKGSGMGEHHGNNIIKYLKSVKRHLRNEKYKEAGIRLEDAMQEAEAIENKIG